MKPYYLPKRVIKIKDEHATIEHLGRMESVNLNSLSRVLFPTYEVGDNLLYYNNQVWKECEVTKVLKDKFACSYIINYYKGRVMC